MFKKSLIILFGLIFGFVIAEVSLLAFFKIEERTAKEQIAINEIKNIYQYDSILGWRLVPGGAARQKNSEFDIVYKINNQGFRDDKDYSFKKLDKKRMIVLGDSFAFSVGVKNQKTFSKILEKKSDYEVLNFGVSGYDPGQYFLFLKNLGLNYDPDIVIYSIYLGNDIEDIILDHPFQGDRYKPYFSLNENDNLILGGMPIPDKKYNQEAVDYRIKNLRFYEKIEWVLKLKTAMLFKNLLKKNFYPVFEKFGFVKSIKDYENNFIILDKILEETKKIISDKKFIVLIIPSKNVKFNYLERKFNEKLKEILNEKNILFIDMVKEAERSDDLYFSQEGHFNERGHSLVAEIISELIKK